MNLPGALWASKNIQLKSPNTIAWIVWSIIMSGCSVSNTQTKNSEIIPTNIQTAGWYKYPDLDLNNIEVIQILWNQKIESSTKPKWLIWEIDTGNDYVYFPTREVRRSNDITVLYIPKFETDRKILIKKIDDILDVPIIACAEWLMGKWPNELSINVPNICLPKKEKQTAKLSKPERWYYTVTINGVLYKYPHSDCKQAKRIKWPPRHNIETFNQSDYRSDIVEWENYTIEQAYIDKCRTKRKSTMKR